MVKLTAELIEQSAQYTNPLRDRELDLRGYKIPVIENLGATLDQFDTIDFSDNEIRKLEGFPLLRRLKCVIINNNRIKRVAESLEESLPFLESLVMTNNSMVELVDLEPLISVTTLTHLSLLKNPVTAKRHYRLYVIYKMPHIRVLDFQKVKLKERDAAAKIFKIKKVPKETKKAKTFTPGESAAEVVRPDPITPATGPSREEMEAIKMAIANASTLEEVVRLKQMLQTGQIPGKKSVDKVDDHTEEEMETDVPNGT